MNRNVHVDSEKESSGQDLVINEDVVPRRS